MEYYNLSKKEKILFNVLDDSLSGSLRVDLRVLGALISKYKYLLETVIDKNSNQKAFKDNFKGENSNGNSDDKQLNTDKGNKSEGLYSSLY